MSIMGLAGQPQWNLKFPWVQFEVLKLKLMFHNILHTCLDMWVTVCHTKTSCLLNQSLTIVTFLRCTWMHPKMVYWKLWAVLTDSEPVCTWTLYIISSELLKTYNFHIRPTTRYLHLDVTQKTVLVLDNMWLFGSVKTWQWTGIVHFGSDTSICWIYGHSSNVGEKVHNEYSAKSLIIMAVRGNSLKVCM